VPAAHALSSCKASITSFCTSPTLYALQRQGLRASHRRPPGFVNHLVGEKLAGAAIAARYRRRSSPGGIA